MARYTNFLDTTETVSKYMVPIRPKWHELLFPDISDFRNGLFGNDPEMYSSESNTIRKAYLCKAPITTNEPGDLLFFYRSRDRRSIEVLAIVDEVMRSNDVAAIHQMTHRRTVYSAGDIANFFDDNPRALLVICFSVVRYFKHSINLENLKRLEIPIPQKIIPLTENQYHSMMGKTSE